MALLLVMVPTQGVPETVLAPVAGPQPTQEDFPCDTMTGLGEKGPPLARWL